MLCVIRGKNCDKQITVQFKSINSWSWARVYTHRVVPALLLAIVSLRKLSAMHRIPQPLGVTSVPTLRQGLLSAIFASTNCILSLDPTTHTLVTYYWSMLQMFASWPISMFAQARWREWASQTWRSSQLSQNPPIPGTVLPVLTTDAAQ